MHAVDQFTVNLEDPENPVLSDKSGKKGADRNGTDIEGQWRAGEHFLLLLSCDSPYDELVSVCLVSATLELIDEIRIGGWYNDGILKNISVVSGLLEFEIFGLAWKVTHHANGQFFSFGSLPKGARRSIPQLFKRRYLKMSSTVVG